MDKEEVINLGYVIRNHKNVYIRLSKNGKPETCCENAREVFTYQKAMNILNNLPKTLKRLDFSIKKVSGTVSKKDKEKEEVLHYDYTPSEDITQWIEKFGTCWDILQDAGTRLYGLNMELSRLDKELSDILHRIEFESLKDMYKGWLVYKKIRENRRKRRKIKDEITIIKMVPKNTSNFNRENVKKAVEGLSKRKYILRIIEGDDIEDDM